MIEIYTFEEWDAIQPKENIIEWGHFKGVESAQAAYNESPYKDAPLAIKRMFYTEYVHRIIFPNP